MKVTTQVEIEVNKDDEYNGYVYVDYYGEPTHQNDGIGGYEFWGTRGYDEGEDYVIFEDIFWDKTKYTEKENQIIEEYLNNNFVEIETMLQEQFDKDIIWHCDGDDGGHDNIDFY